MNVEFLKSVANDLVCAVVSIDEIGFADSVEQCLEPINVLITDLFIFLSSIAFILLIYYSESRIQFYSLQMFIYI